MIDRLRRHAAWWAAAATLFAYLLWTASSSSDPFAFGQANGSYYNLLADAFLAGKLHLLVQPAPELLKLADPYSYAANAPYQLHDASLYHGHYYLTWGPVPVLLLYVPFRLLLLGQMTDTLAATLFAFGGLCFAIALLRYLTRRYLPGTTKWMRALGALAVVTGSALPFTLRRVGIYEVSISAGYCFLFAGLYFLATGLLEPPYRLRRLALASLFLGLGAGSRTSIVLPALLPLVALLAIIVRDRSEMSTRLALALAGPLIICGTLLATYNLLRFGSITEYGQHYQLMSGDITTKTFASFAYIPPGGWLYLFSRAHITAAFPFFHAAAATSYPGHFPSGYDGVEPTAGLVTNVPISLLAFAPWLLFRRPGDRRLRGVAVILLSLGVLLVLLLSYSLWGATMRYEVDFATLLLLPSVLAWFALARMTNRIGRMTVHVLGTAALAWGIAFGAALGMSGYGDSFAVNQPGAFAALERATEPIATGIAWLEGSQPQIVHSDPVAAVTAAPNGPLLNGATLTVGQKPVTLSIVSPSSGGYRLWAAATGVTTTLGANLCTNGGFGAGAAGWAPFSGDEGLQRASQGHGTGSGALRVSMRNATLQGVVYATPKGQDISGGTLMETAVWMKGTPGAALEMQVRIVNTDGTSSGTITSFTANGKWQHETAIAPVTPGKTGDVVQILALRRFPAGRDTFLLDGAVAARVLSATTTRLRVSTPGHTEMVPALLPPDGVPIHLGVGLTRVTLATNGPTISLDALTLVLAPR